MTDIHCYRYCCTRMKFSIEDFFSKSDQIRRKLQIWSHLLKKSSIENFIFCTVYPQRISFNKRLLFHRIEHTLRFKIKKNINLNYGGEGVAIHLKNQSVGAPNWMSGSGHKSLEVSTFFSSLTYFRLIFSLYLSENIRERIDFLCFQG